MQFLQPHKVLQHFDIDEGMSVAELHSGSGFFTSLLSQKVGKYGKVFPIHHNKECVTRKGNIHPHITHPSLEEEIELPEQQDRVLVSNIFLILHPHRAFSHAHRLLKGGGKMIVIDRKHKDIELEKIMHLAGIAGFIREKHFHAGEVHFGLVFKKV